MSNICRFPGRRAAATILVAVFLTGACSMREDDAGENGNADENTLSKQDASKVIVLPVSPCSPALGVCEIGLPEDGLLTVDFPERPPRPLYPFTVRATLVNANIRSLRMRLSGEEMDMGTNNYNLTSETPGQYQGKVILPICATALMRWQADFILEFDDKTSVVASFRFTTGENTQ